MERHEILDAMSELKLYGMRASFDEIAGKGLVRRDEIYPLIAGLIRAERTHRQARSISYRISGAKFPVLKDLDSFVFADTPVDQGQVRELATGTFLDAKRNTIFIGGTGTGKTHLCIAVAAAVIRSRARGRFFNLVDLVNQLEQEKAAGKTETDPPGPLPGFSSWVHRDLPRPPLRATPRALRSGRRPLLCTTRISPISRIQRGSLLDAKSGSRLEAN